MDEPFAETGRQHAHEPVGLVTTDLVPTEIVPTGLVVTDLVPADLLPADLLPVGRPVDQVPSEAVGPRRGGSDGGSGRR